MKLLSLLSIIHDSFITFISGPSKSIQSRRASCINVFNSLLIVRSKCCWVICFCSCSVTNKIQQISSCCAFKSISHHSLIAFQFRLNKSFAAPSFRKHIRKWFVVFTTRQCYCRTGPHSPDNTKTNFAALLLHFYSRSNVISEPAR